MKGLPKKPYILYIGNDYPHKNLKRLKLAFKNLNADWELVLITEFVSEKDLHKLYKHACAYVFPSLSEGFGLPPLEAMARGVPVACSRASCLPEILGDAAAYFDPLDVDDIANTIERVVNNKKLRKKLVRKGLEQVKKYSWEKMAKETLEIYSKCIS